MLGMKNMSRILLNNGLLYLSVPVGIDRVEFNSNYVFDPNKIINIALGFDFAS